MDDNRGVVGRFAPSPSGYLHAGNIFAYLIAWLISKKQDGEIVLRIEDLDSARSKDIFSESIIKDLESLGLYWDRGPFFQHDRHDVYLSAVEELESKGVIYPCFCTRADIFASSAPHIGERIVYSGKCRDLDSRDVTNLINSGRKFSKRLVVCDEEVGFTDFFQGFYSQDLDRDFIIMRSDGQFAYQLAVVIDDALQGINNVVRGVDLLSSTPQQIYLQTLLGFEEPEYAHIPLFVAEDGRRLSKRDRDAGIESMLSEYKTYEGIIGHIAYVSGLIEHDTALSVDDLLNTVDISDIHSAFENKSTIVWK